MWQHICARLRRFPFSLPFRTGYSMRFLAALTLFAFVVPAMAETPFKMPKDEGAAAFVESNVLATFYHELGHAYIDVLELPVLGREEDAADTLSAILIHNIWDEDNATEILYHTASAFLLYDIEAAKVDGETPYWDEHSLDMQRYYNLVCLFYGANPDVREDVATELELPETRAEGCVDEFELADASWGGMLEGLEPDKTTKGLKMIGVLSGDPVANLLAAEVKDLNAAFGLPHEITVTVAACGEANAFYDPSDRSITICTEYVEDLARIYAENP